MFDLFSLQRNISTRGNIGVKTMKILAIETSCDETAAAVTENNIVHSNVISSQIDLHKKYGGVVPELASRMHIENISWVVEKALDDATVTFNDIDAIAVTYAPGLIGALLVGVNYAKSLAFALSKPLIAVHHIEGHIAANYIEHSDLEPPFLCLVASGGHSSIVLVKDYNEHQLIAKTRDDAAGEAFDKIARVLGLGYPGGPAISKIARGGNSERYSFPRVSMANSLDFSFSGVKTAVINLIHNSKEEINNADVAASFQEAICDVLASRLLFSAEKHGIERVAIAGGVAANSLLREKLAGRCCVPSPIYCTDNAAMIGVRAAKMHEISAFANIGLNACASMPIKM